MTKTKKVNLDKIAEDLLNESIAEIDAGLEEIEKRLTRYQKLIDTKTKLLSARRALLGTGSRTTGNAGTRLTGDDLQARLKEKPGSTASQLAEFFGVPLTTVSSHIYRNKDRYIKKGDGYWARDPEAGLDTADDIEEDE